MAGILRQELRFLADLQDGFELSALVQKRFAECLPREVKLREERSRQAIFVTPVGVGAVENC